MTDLISYAIKLSLVGMGIVFLVLVFISFLVALLRRIDQPLWKAREKAQKIAALDKEPTIDELTLVLISAAIATYLKGRHRIRSVKRVQSGPWSSQGRAILLGSHVLQKKGN